ncbi:pimeloyl-ACP methyl ester carboxylesterase [Sphingobacterium sp. BIGb0165]|nr:alpha/beta hydrolase [Sphingobacterium sp. BIGb0165]MCS4224661.1 pimeloyl-ACP methyl ester carboxylesterase [Sphingobacterium sp. BIGb0165]
MLSETPSYIKKIQALVDACYHVIVPNQRGYDKSSCPTEITDYDLEHLTGDLIDYLITLVTRMPPLSAATGVQILFGV